MFWADAKIRWLNFVKMYSGDARLATTMAALMTSSQSEAQSTESCEDEQGKHK